MVELPEELFIEILSWLPVKYLLRFRCVSKWICAYIDGSDFINSHLSKSSQNFNLSNKLIFSVSSEQSFCVCDVNLDMEEDNLHIENPVSCLLKGYIAGYCNGLLLLLKYKSTFSLWNPSTRQFMDLPDFPVRDSESFYYLTSGLGYDEFIDDYKAFCIFYVIKKHDRSQFEAQVWVCGLKSNIWRRAQNLNFPCLCFPETGVFTTDGSLQWLWNTERDIDEIVAFDVRNETLSVVPQPVCSINSESLKGVLPELHVLEGHLCISYLRRSMPLQADLCIRKKDGADQFTWTPLFSVAEPLFSDKVWFKTVRVLGCSKRGDRILIDFGMGYMVSYNLKERSFGKVDIDRILFGSAKLLFFVLKVLSK